jgi:hypothetical protein
MLYILNTYTRPLLRVIRYSHIIIICICNLLINKPKNDNHLVLIFHVFYLYENARMPERGTRVGV